MKDEKSRQTKSDIDKELFESFKEMNDTNFDYQEDNESQEPIIMPPLDQSSENTSNFSAHASNEIKENK